MNTLQELLERVKADFFAHDPVYTECTALGREDVSDYSPFICTDRFVAEDVLTDENEAKKWLAVLMEFGPLVGGSGEELGYIQSHDTTWQEVAQRLLVAWLMLHLGVDVDVQTEALRRKALLEEHNQK